MEFLGAFIVIGVPPATDVTGVRGDIGSSLLDTPTSLTLLNKDCSAPFLSLFGVNVEIGDEGGGEEGLFKERLLLITLCWRFVAGMESSASRQHKGLFDKSNEVKPGKALNNFAGNMVII